MKKMWRLLRDHVSNDISARYYIIIALFLSVSLWINYFLDLENAIINAYTGRPVRMLWYLLLYTFAYFGTITIQCITKKTSLSSYPAPFWILSFVGLCLLALSAGFPYLYPVVRFFVSDYRLVSWSYSIYTNLSGFILTTLPFLIIAHLIEKDKREYFGITPAFDIRPYLGILFLIIPLIAIAAFEKGLGSYYPTYKENAVAQIMGWPSWWPAVLYEFFYGLDFFNVEFLFRGFMVIGLSRIIGKEALMPMVVTYCFLHFGKPPGEAISSIFGGYVLGVVALYTRSIWGGVMLHIGVAWTMELAAFLTKSS